MSNNAETPVPRAALLLTRPRASAARFARGLDQRLLQDVRLCVSPLLEIAAVPFDPDLARYNAVIFSSANGVEPVGSGLGRPAYCIGDRTGAAATAMGWHVLATAIDADDLVSKLLALRPKGPLIHLSGKHRRGEIAERLTAAGIATDLREVYDQRLLALSSGARDLIGGKMPVIVPLFSPRTAAQFAQEAKAAPNALVIAMSGAVAEALGKLAVAQVHIAHAPTGAEMRRCVEMLLRQDSLG